MAPKKVPNGTVEAPIEVSSLPPVVGINFGNSYASIAVFTKEGLAECIANEDGERQIACAVAFQGEEMYIGNQASHQLVKNSKNTIIGFRNLLGKKFSDISQSGSTTSAPVIQHPNIPNEPAYRVEILQPAPTPLPASTVTSNFNTPAASHAPTPRSEPIPAERILTVSEVATIFIKSLVQSAEDFLGKKIQGAVCTVPTWFTSAQRDALEKAATDAGVNVLQLLDEAAAAAATTTTELWSTDLNLDRTQLVVDVGASSVSLALLSVREGLAYVLASSTTPDIGGDQIDEKLIKHLASDFTKKTKTPLTVCPAKDIADKRAEAKLRLAIEHTKRTISASPGAATCSVESLKDGVDFAGSINRMRFDMVASTTYANIGNAVIDLLASIAFDSHDVDEIVYVGGTACLPGLDERICLAGGFREDVETPFSRGTVVGGGVGDPTTILARGSAIQAELLFSLSDDSNAEIRQAFTQDTKANEVKATTRSLGVLFPDPGSDNDLGGTWIPVVQKETALPVRRAVAFDVSLTEESKRFAFEVWEVKEGYRIEKVQASPSDDDDDDEPEEEELKHRTITKESCLGFIELEALLGIKAKGKSKDAGKWTTSVEVQFILGIEGDLEVRVHEIGGNGATGTLVVPAP